MPDNPYIIGDKVWFVKQDFRVRLATVEETNAKSCLVHVEGDRIRHYVVRFKKLYWSEKMALVDAKVQVQTRMLDKRAQLDALAEIRTAIRQRLTEVEDA